MWLKTKIFLHVGRRPTTRVLRSRYRKGLLLREDGGLTIAKDLKLNVEEPHLEEPPLMPELEAVEVEKDDAETKGRRLRGKSSLKMLQVEEELGKEMWFEEMDIDSLVPEFLGGRVSN